MAPTKITMTGTEHLARAKALSLPVSTKQSIEIARAIRYKTTSHAKKFLEEVIALNKAVPFVRYKRNVGHKAGIASGRFPQKAAQQFLKLVKSAEANAQFKGLNASDLKIVQLMANLASAPAGGGRHRHRTKRTNLEIVVQERSVKEKRDKSDRSMKTAASTKTAISQTASKTAISEEAATTSAKTVSAAPAQGYNPVQSHKIATPATTPVANPAANPPVGAQARDNNAFVKAPASVTQNTSRKEQSTARQEMTSEELLRKAQARAAELNQKEKDKKAVEEVSRYYNKLTQKGTLRENKTSVR